MHAHFTDYKYRNNEPKKRGKTKIYAEFQFDWSFLYLKHLPRYVHVYRRILKLYILYKPSSYHFNIALFILNITLL